MIKERRGEGEQYWFMTSKFHLLNLSIAFMLVVALASTFVVGRRVEGGGGCYRFRNPWTAEGDENPKHTNSSDWKRAFDRERKREKTEGKEEFPEEQRTVTNPMYRLSSRLCLS